MATLYKIAVNHGRYVYIGVVAGNGCRMRREESGMSGTLNDLLSQQSLGLSVVVPGGAGALDRAITWAHSSEYADPTPYLDGGELLMTVGLDMDASVAGERYRGYVSRLVKAGVSGIGFGVGVHHGEIPQWLVTQCVVSGMPLVSVPLGTPFIAVEKEVSRSAADARQRDIAHHYRSQQQLLRAVHSLDPISTIVSHAAELIGGWVALLNANGNVIESSHHFLPIDVENLGETLTFSTLGETKFMVSKGYDIAVFHIVSPNGTTLGYLVAGAKGERGTLDHPLVAGAVSLLSLAISSSADAQRVLARLRSAMTRRCLEGEYEAVRPYAQDLWDGMPAEPLAVLRLTGEYEAVESAQRLFEPLRRSVAKNLNPVVFGIIEGDLWAVISQSNANEWVGQLTRDTRLTVGQSSGCIWRDLSRARHEAYQAANRALADGLSTVRYGQGKAGGSLDEMVEPSLMRAFADLKLAPIGELVFNPAVGPHPVSSDAIAGTRDAGAVPVSGHGNMAIPAVEVLRVWLGCRCSAEAAARRLGIHRHTMTKYLGVIARALGVELHDPGVIAELWYACRFTRFGSTRE